MVRSTTAPPMLPGCEQHIHCVLSKVTCFKLIYVSLLAIHGEAFSLICFLQRTEVRNKMDFIYLLSDMTPPL